MKVIILGLLILFFIILISYELYEGFSSQPLPVETPIRSNGTCSDPEMNYIYDRYSYAYPYPSDGCSAGYSSNSYYGIPYCVPNCPTGYIAYSNDPTLCIRSDGKCGLSSDLNSTIQMSWAQVCGPIYKANINVLSTMGSISTVVSTINSQFYTLDSNFGSFSNTITSYNGGNSSYSNLRNTVFNNNIISNYYELRNLTASVNSNFNELSNKKSRFDYIYNAFDCANYM